MEACVRILNILVVDDSEEQAEILQMLLKSDGHEVTICFGGQEACSLVNQNRYDMVFTDISMPEVNGIQVMKHVKEHSPQTEIIPITAFGDWGVYAESIQLGAKAFINKPYNVEDIQKIVNRIAAVSS